MSAAVYADPAKEVTRRRVLVVIDDDAAAKVLCAALCADGYAVAIVRDGPAALRLARHWEMHGNVPADAVVMCGGSRLPDSSPFRQLWHRATSAPTAVVLASRAPTAVLSALRRSLPPA